MRIKKKCYTNPRIQIGVDMETKVYKYIKENKMIENGDKIVVGVSGGADSVCLLNILLYLQDFISFDICVVHIEHGIRGQDSIEDAKYVEKLAADKGVSFKMFSYDVQAEGKKLGLGTEEAGRILRYQSFEKAAKEYFGNENFKIAVAHNKNDSVETVLHNLIRGTGLKGVSGIPGQRDNIIRPLLCVERCEIEKWLEKRNIGYRTDCTNFETDYTRNKIRLNILPQIREDINPQVINNISAFADLANEANEYIEEQVEAAYEKYVSLDGYKIIIHNECLSENKVIIKGIIKMSIGYVAKGLKDISRCHIEDTLNLFSKQVGKKMSLLDGIAAKRIYEGVRIEPMKDIRLAKKENDVTKKILIEAAGEYKFNDLDFTITIEKWEKNQLIPEKMYTKWFDYDKIEGVLQLRNRESKDYIQINQAGQRKKLKAYFVDNKIPQEERQNITLLADDSHIIWIVGYRISEAYKVTDSTKRVLKVQVNGGNENGR